MKKMNVLSVKFIHLESVTAYRVVEDHILGGYYNVTINIFHKIYVVEDHILSGYYNIVVGVVRV